MNPIAHHPQPTLTVHPARFPNFCNPQAVAAKARTSALLPLRTSRGHAALRVVAFREDDRQSQIKKGTREAKGQARNVANQGKQQLQRGKQNINKRECNNGPFVLALG
jgi:hypothetical protein